MKLYPVAQINLSTQTFMNDFLSASYWWWIGFKVGLHSTIATNTFKKVIMALTKRKKKEFIVLLQLILR